MIIPTRFMVFQRGPALTKKYFYQSAKLTNDSSPAVYCWVNERAHLQSAQRTAE
jgi:hypothetical protein